MKTNYILIDYENVQPKTLPRLAAGCFKIFVFVGAHQKKIPIETANSLQQFGSNAAYIEISSTSPNALDFHIAYYIGKLAATDPSGVFYIISKDTGFDPLIAHLKQGKIAVSRHPSLDMLVPEKEEKSKLQTVIDNLQRLKNNKPGTLKRLSNTIVSYFKDPELSESEIAALIDGLSKKNVVHIEGTRVDYPEH